MVVFDRASHKKTQVRQWLPKVSKLLVATGHPHEAEIMKMTFELKETDEVSGSLDLCEERGLFHRLLKNFRVLEKSHLKVQG